MIGDDERYYIQLAVGCLILIAAALASAYTSIELFLSLRRKGALQATRGATTQRRRVDMIMATVLAAVAVATGAIGLSLVLGVLGRLGS